MNKYLSIQIIQASPICNIILQGHDCFQVYAHSLSIQLTISEFKQCNKPLTFIFPSK